MAEASGEGGPGPTDGDKWQEIVPSVTAARGTRRTLTGFQDLRALMMEHAGKEEQEKAQAAEPQPSAPLEPPRAAPQAAPALPAQQRMPGPWIAQETAAAAVADALITRRAGSAWNEHESEESARVLQHAPSVQFSRGSREGLGSREATRSNLRSADASPVLPISSGLSNRLQRDCARAITFLERLQRPAYSRSNPDDAPAMPKTALRFCKALALMRQHKLGLGLSWIWGSGFIIAHLGPGEWSAPCFLKDRMLSVGCTAGYRLADFCVAVPTEASMALYQGSMADVSCDFAMNLGVDPGEIDSPVVVRAPPRRSPQDPIVVDESEDPKAYVITDGGIVDLSVCVGWHLVDATVNAALYGAKATPVDILQGRVGIPVEFAPLYAAISELAATADVVRATASQFELSKALVGNSRKSRSGTLRSSMSTKLGGSHRTGSGSLTSTSIDRTTSSPPSSKNGSPQSTLHKVSVRLFGDVGLLPLNLDLEEDKGQAKGGGDDANKTEEGQAKGGGDDACEAEEGQVKGGGDDAFIAKEGREASDPDTAEPSAKGVRHVEALAL